MNLIVLKPLHNRGRESIGIYFDNRASLNTIIRKQVGGKWSQINRCWYVPLNEEAYNKLRKVLDGKAELNIAALKDYLEKRNQKARHKKQPSIDPTIKKDAQTNSFFFRQPVSASAIKPMAYISQANSHIIPAMKQALVLKAYSPSTIKTYLNEMAQFLQSLKNHSADDFSIERIKKYLQYCLEKLKLTENTLHSRINALKFYYEQVLKKEKFFFEIPRPKKQIQLPRFFNQDEIASIIKSAGNLKHKTMLMLAYSAGLRVSEVVGIKTNSIDSKRMCIFIKQAKGKKDRVAALSPVLLVMLREYWNTCKPDRNGYLFTGQKFGEPYNCRSLQLVLDAAKKKAGVMKPGSVHALRHSFATHLLDKGTDVTMIMKLLGHNDIKTTLRYLHVTNRDMLQIISPLDDLKLD